MFRCRAVPLALLLGGALASCGIDAVGSATGDAGAGDASADGPRPIDAQAGPDAAVDADALDGEASVPCPICPSGFTCTSGVCTDSAQTHFTLASNPTANWTWAYRTVITPAADIIVYPASHTEPMQGGIQAWSRDPNSVTPAVFFNPNAAVVHPYDTFTMQPGELAFHPGAANENSVIRWTAPVTATYTASIAVRGLSGYMGAPATTTGVTVLKGTAPLASVQLDASTSVGTIQITPTPFSAGDTLDVRVDFGANLTFGFDSTGVDVIVRLP